MERSCCHISRHANLRKVISLSFVLLFSSNRNCSAMMGSLIKTVFARKLGVAPDRIVVVGIMPCVAKKDEIERDQLKDANGKKETEFVLTTREVGALLRESSIHFGSLEV